MMTFLFRLPVLLLLAAVGAVLPVDAASVTCAVCGQEIKDFMTTLTDQVTGGNVIVCSNCYVTLPRCFICGISVKLDATTLPDGRRLCDRDAKTVVLEAGETRRVAEQINEDMNRNFARFATFPDKVDVEVIDRIDEFRFFHQSGFDFESPNLLGCIKVVPSKHDHRYLMSLMTGQTVTGLKATVAHELGHAWAGDNVSQERRNRIGRDAEEGFCEMLAYLLMDAQHEEAQKRIILRNRYTRGQVDLFIEAEQRYGLEDVLDWMKFGNTGSLESGRLDKIRDVTMPANPAAPPPHRRAMTNSAALNGNTNAAAILKPAASESEFKLEGILWGAPPFAIINSHTFAPNDEAKVKLGASNVLIRCVAITKNSVRIWEVDSGRELELYPK